MNTELFSEVLQIVRNLNIVVHERTKANWEYESPFTLTTDGFAVIVELFNGIVIYNSEDEPRQFNEERNAYESMEYFLRRKFNEQMDIMVNKIGRL